MEDQRLNSALLNLTSALKKSQENAVNQAGGMSITEQSVLLIDLDEEKQSSLYNKLISWPLLRSLTVNP